MRLKVFLVVFVLTALQLGSAQECVLDFPTSCAEIEISNPDSDSGYYWIQTGSSVAQKYCDFDPIGTQNNPAASCNDVKERCPGVSSGYYWVENSQGQVVQVYCDMERTCGNVTGGWMRVASIDMRNSSETCPSGLTELTEGSKRVCSMNIFSGGCSSTTLTTHDIQYSRVCGKIIGYQRKTPDGFAPYHFNTQLTIDDGYVDGISMTHGASPREHIWTFVVAHDEVLVHPYALCPCTHNANPHTINIPPYVGDDYFCETGSRELSTVNDFYADDPLWDGENCGSVSSCCSFNNPPWFSKELPLPTTSDDIEMRLCADENRNNEDITFEQVELYVQ